MRARDGFTLIEVVLALGLLLLGATVILGLFSFGAALSRTAELRARSATAAEAVVLDLEEGLFPLEDDGSAGEPRVVTDRPVPGHTDLIYSARAVPRPDHEPGRSREYQVEVEMRWRGGAGRRGRKFSVLLLREISFGERMRSALAPPSNEGAPAE